MPPREERMTPEEIDIIEAAQALIDCWDQHGKGRRRPRELALETAVCRLRALES